MKTDHSKVMLLYEIVPLLVITFAPRSSSDFNVILPELCSAPGRLNLTWIESMVRLGIREEQAHHALNIWGTKASAANGHESLIPAAEKWRRKRGDSGTLPPEIEKNPIFPIC
ncbi:hypothetical protein Fcan01_13836 [Folsomia candida]|uniref:Uncharacterized protein n=1 Tax=Folsomia candida TaxID=158441 RepID=A0A226E5K9_FOLCA|nr:hypothetical protein Fcan01_13836 [Folsomia candida]